MEYLRYSSQRRQSVISDFVKARMCKVLSEVQSRNSQGPIHVSLIGALKFPCRLELLLNFIKVQCSFSSVFNFKG